VRVTQATLSRDLRELRVVKAPHADGETYYALPSEAEEEIPALDRLLPHLLVAIDGVQNLLVVRTLLGGAQPVAEAIDWEEWPEVVGTIAGDDTIFILLRKTKDRAAITRRLREIAGN
jgi:transcriptional regulator of arginine metabolism